MTSQQELYVALGHLAQNSCTDNMVILIAEFLHHRGISATEFNTFIKFEEARRWQMHLNSPLGFTDPVRWHDYAHEFDPCPF